MVDIFQGKISNFAEYVKLLYQIDNIRRRFDCNLLSHIILHMYMYIYICTCGVLRVDTKM